MPCKPQKEIDGRPWPLFRSDGDDRCVFRVQVPTAREAARVASAAEEMLGYLKRSRFYRVEEGAREEVRVYLYFAQ